MPGVITICTKNSERDRKRVRVERKKIRLDWFFPPMPSKERGNLYPRTKFKCHSQKATCNETICGTERDVIFFFFFSWINNVNIIVLLLWHHLVFRSVKYQQLLWRKQKFYHFWKSGPLPMVKNHVNSHSSLLYVAHLAAIYLGNPLPPHTTLKYMILFYQFKKIIVYFFPLKVRLGKQRSLFRFGWLNQIDPI